MTVGEMIRRNRTNVLSIIAFLSISYLFISSVTRLPDPRLYFSRQSVPDHCKDAKFQWRGANDRIYPASGRPVYITHLDYSHGIANHKVSIFLARSQNEEFSIKTDIFTSHEVPSDNFEISYNSRDELIINTLVPKSSPILTEENTKDSGHCIVINVELLIPVSKPLTGLKFDFPQANFFVHESTWGSLPYLDLQIGTGDLLFNPGQRLHIGKMTAKIDTGSITGTYMLTETLKVELKEGTVDLDIAYSPYLIGATIDFVQFAGSLDVRLQDLFYRPTTGTYWLSTGTLTLQYPNSFEGLISMDSKVGSVTIEGPSVKVLQASEKGVLPVWIEAQHGRDERIRTKVRGGTADVRVTIDGPTSQHQSLSQVEDATS